MAATDYDRRYDTLAPMPVGEYDRPSRNEVKPYSDRRLDIVVKPSFRSQLSESTMGGLEGVSAWCFNDPVRMRQHQGRGREVASMWCFSNPEMMRR
jgi:hypothetical protein